MEHGTRANPPTPGLMISARISDFLIAAPRPTEAGVRTLAAHFALLRHRSTQTADESLNLSKRALAPGANDFVLETLQQSGDLEDAIRRAARAYNMIHGGYYNQPAIRGDRLVYAIDDTNFPYSFQDADARFALMEGLLIFVHAMLSLAMGVDLTPHLRQIGVRRPQRNGRDDGLVDFWDAPIRFGQADFRLEYDKGANRLAPPPRMHALMIGAVFERIDDMIAVREQRSDRKSLRERLSELIGEKRCDEADAARSLGMSVATLRRRLHEQGESFRNIRAMALNALACAMLRQGRPALETAEALGYVDLRSFSRAFKAWNGATPTQFAAREAAPAPSPSAEP